MKKVSKYIVILISAFVVGCGVTANNDFNPADVVRQPVGTPLRFEAPTGVVLDNSSCKSPLTDPYNSIKIVLVRSNSDFGDYEVPMGKYGIAGNELLRIKCSTGEVVGVVKR